MILFKGSLWYTVIKEIKGAGAIEKSCRLVGNRVDKLMRYLGSKTLLLDNIYEITKEYGTQGIFCDPFGGIGTVGRYMKEKGFSVVTGDLLHFAHCFQVARIQNNKIPNFSALRKVTGCKSVVELEKYLSEITETEGWFIEEYSLKRRFFISENVQHLQACVNSIWKWEKEGILDEAEYATLIASLIHQMDKVANTAGTYYAYLKDWHRKAKRPFEFHFLFPIYGNGVYHAEISDANVLVKKTNCDILYLDPPYNERSYGRYYHIPEMIARGNIPVPEGKSGMFAYKDTESKYNKKEIIEKAFKELIDNTDAGCIIFHYTDNGLLESQVIRGILEGKGKLDEFYFDSKGYRTVSCANRCRHHIYRVMR